MLREELPHVTITMPNGQHKNTTFEEGSLFVSNDQLLKPGSSVTVTLQTLKDPRYIVRCKRNMLALLDVEDVNWLNPIQPPKNRLKVYKNPQHWGERKLLKEGLLVNYSTTLSNLKGIAKVVSYSFLESFDGTIVEIQIIKVHTACSRLCDEYELNLFKLNTRQTVSGLT